MEQKKANMEKSSLEPVYLRFLYESEGIQVFSSCNVVLEQKKSQQLMGIFNHETYSLERHIKSMQP